jgi:hypothetical protein
VRSNIPDDIPTNPVDPRGTGSAQGLESQAAESAIEAGRHGLPSLRAVEPIRHQRLRLRSPAG